MLVGDDCPLTHVKPFRESAYCWRDATFTSVSMLSSIDSDLTIGLTGVGTFSAALAAGEVIYRRSGGKKIRSIGEHNEAAADEYRDFKLVLFT